MELELAAVRKAYGDVVALDGVSLRAEANETVAVYTILTLVKRLVDAGVTTGGGKSNGNGAATAPSDATVEAEVKDPGPRAAKVG